MRLVLQRVERARVEVGGEKVGAIGKGMLVLVAVERGDGPEEVKLAADKLVHLRIFADAAGKMNLDVRETGGAVLVVSQFTLAARLSKGRRPSFDRAAPPEEAQPLVDSLVEAIVEKGVPVAEGRFGSYMKVELLNDGPVTFVLDL